MKKVAVFLAGTMLLFAACDPLTRTRPAPVGEGREARREVSQAADAGTRMLGDQERALRQELAAAPGVAVERKDRLLRVVLQTDDCFSGDPEGIKPGANAVFDRLAQNLKQYPQTLVLLEGHTDRAGTDAHNMALSYQRALAVKTALVARGIEDFRLQVQGVGRAEPVASNDTEAGRRQNRRVVVNMMPFPAAD